MGERANNMQHGRSHTPHVDDLCRLAFRNKALCEGRLYFAVTLAIYDLIAWLCASDVDADESSPELRLLEELRASMEIFCVQDDALASERATLQEYEYYIVKPLKRAHRHLAPGVE